MLIQRAAFAALVALGLVPLCLVTRIGAAGGVTRLYVSTDVAAEAGALALADEDIAELRVSAASWSVAVDLTTVLPPGCDIDAMTHFPGRGTYFSTAADCQVGAVQLADEDIARWTGTQVVMLFDGSANGLPASADIDALHVVSLTPLELYLSVREATTIAGQGYGPADIVSYASGTYTLAVSGATLLGTSSAANLDGLYVDVLDGVYLFSVDIDVQRGALAARDEDVLAWDGTDLALFANLSTAGLLTTAADVDALDGQQAPQIGSIRLDHRITTTAAGSSWTVVYSDRDNDPPATFSVRVDGGASVAFSVQTGCGAPLCDRSMINGELYTTSAPVGYGATHSYSSAANDGLDSVSSGLLSGPSWVSDPSDADGDQTIDARDLAVILIEVHDDNGGTSIDVIRNGHFIRSWGGCDTTSTFRIDARDLASAAAVIFR